MAESIEIEINPTIEDHLRFYRWLFKRRNNRSHQAKILLFLTIAPLLLSVGLVICKNRYWVSPLVAIVILLLLYMPATLTQQRFYLYLRKRWLEKAFADDANQRLPVTFCFSDTGVESNTNVSKGVNAWVLYKEAVETEQDFYLEISPSTYHLLPKHCFRDGQQIAEFREMIHRNISERARLTN